MFRSSVICMFLFVSLLCVPSCLQGAENEQSAGISGGWFGYASPTNLAVLLSQSLAQVVRSLLTSGGSFDQAMDRNVPKLKNTLKEFTEDATKANGSLDVAIKRASSSFKEAFKEAVDDVTKEGESLDVAIGRVSNKLREELKKAVDDVAKKDESLDRLAHRTTVHLAQNVGKMFLSTIMGGFGAIVAYKNLIEYFEAQKDTKIIYAKWHDQQKERYAQHEGAGAAKVLSKRLKEADLICSRNQQSIRAYLAATGITTFAVACLLCSYWIR